MTSRELLESLLHAEHEDHVISVLGSAGYSLDDESIWVPLGQNAGNFTIVGNQQENAAAAFIEKVVNSIDAVLMGECHRVGINPETSEAPDSMQQAVERFFKVLDGRLDNLLASQQTELAARIHVVATGEKSSPSYCIVDRGEGQTPDRFPQTFLSTGEMSPKAKVNFVQGKFNAGGTGSLQFCGQHNIQLILSRRQPYALESNDDSGDLWGFSVVRRRRPQGGERGSVFVYLAPGGTVPRFAADSLPLLPGPSSQNKPAAAYSQELEHGTCVKMYNYQWSARGIATIETRRHLERVLHNPCLPFRISETRSYRANYYATTSVGVGNLIESKKSEDGESRKMEAGFPAPATISLRGIGELPIRIGVWKESVHKRSFPTGVYFLVNGQVHGQFSNDFASRNLKFDWIRDHLLVSVDCTSIDRGVAEDLFMASRDRLRRNEHYDEIRDALKQELESHQGLKDLNHARRKARTENSEDSPSAISNIINDLIRRDPGLAELFGTGGRIITSTGPGVGPPFKGRKFPTYFRLEKNPKGQITKQCPVNRTVRVVFETDAENEYFTRPADCGELQIEPSPDLIESSNLWNGKFTVRFRTPWDAKVGDSIKVRALVSDVERAAQGPFVSEFALLAKDEVDRDIPPAGTKRPISNPGAPNPRNQTPTLDLPSPIEVKRDHWGPAYRIEGPNDAFRIKQRPEEGYDFFVNVDNRSLIKELANRQNDPAQVKYWFKWGLTLAALGMIRNLKDEGPNGDKPEDRGEGGAEDLEWSAALAMALRA